MPIGEVLYHNSRQKKTTLNARSELISTCRNKKKFSCLNMSREPPAPFLLSLMSPMLSLNCSIYFEWFHQSSLPISFAKWPHEPQATELQYLFPIYAISIVCAFYVMYCA